MRQDFSRLERYRDMSHPFGSERGQREGAFAIPSPGANVTVRSGSVKRQPNNDLLTVIAHDGRWSGWEHVSVSLPKRCPTWAEMQFVKCLFWEEEETVFQLHPSRSAYIDRTPFVLHLWRRVGEDLELPPADLI